MRHKQLCLLITLITISLSGCLNKTWMVRKDDPHKNTAPIKTINDKPDDEIKRLTSMLKEAETAKAREINYKLGILYLKTNDTPHNYDAALRHLERSLVDGKDNEETEVLVTLLRNVIEMMKENKRLTETNKQLTSSISEIEKIERQVDEKKVQAK